ncbi:hypothetical protein [Mycobacterium botniense]|uniref:Uncharacterized protein n=1 Tax=Mycobacterium botniense TaxID=84962 RepID=A0A7I9XZE9_9MYCO|nr:hypothetical protein [Mycobacterium botniense]GFG75192.1 hypothetical protein MBOT_25570 [Mycobacterium botniense]
MAPRDVLKADIPGYVQGGAANTPPPPISPAPVPPPASPMDALLGLVPLAANTSVPADNTAAQAGYADRELKVGDALTKFPANEEESAAKLSAVGSDPNQMLQMAQQLPQMATGVAQSVAGAIGGLINPLAQIPQQAAQVGQQALQAGMGALQQSAGGGAAAAEGIPAELLGAEGALGAGEGGLGAAGTGAAGLADTAPAAMLGPPPAPSAATVPMSAPSTPPVPPTTPEPTAGPRGGMGAMPMVPPGAVHGGGPGSDVKPDTKRVVPPTVKNGGPVQGRIITPPATPEVTKRVEGKPVASRRILLPEHGSEDDGADQTR